MNKNVRAYVGGTNLPKCLLLVILLSMIAVPVFGAPNFTPVFDITDHIHVNSSSRLSNDASTPFMVWVGAILIGLILVVLSLMGNKLFTNGEEGLVSIMAWFPIAFALYTSFAVDIVDGFGATGGANAPVVNGTYATNDWVLLVNHTVYHFDVAAIGLLIFLFFAFGNTYRIWVSQKKLTEISRVDEVEHL